MLKLRSKIFYHQLDKIDPLRLLPTYLFIEILYTRPKTNFLALISMLLEKALPQLRQVWSFKTSLQTN